MGADSVSYPHISLTVEVPLPLPASSPNARPHWGTRKREVAQMRSEAKILGRYALGEWINARIKVSGKTLMVNPLFRGKTKVTYTYFCAPTIEKRVRPKDADNATACCKPYLDGLRDAGIISDDTAAHVRIESPVLHRRKKFHKGRACVEIHLEAL